MGELTTLYRPVALKELELIRASGLCAFPPAQLATDLRDAVRPRARRPPWKIDVIGMALGRANPRASAGASS